MVDRVRTPRLESTETVRLTVRLSTAAGAKSEGRGLVTETPCREKKVLYKGFR